MRDVVVAVGEMGDFSTTSSSATQLPLFKVYVNRRKDRLVLVLLLQDPRELASWVNQIERYGRCVCASVACLSVR